MDDQAYFELDGREVVVDLFTSNHGRGFGCECPRCGTWGILLDESRSFEVGPQGRLTVDGPIVCRKRDCHLAFRIEDGVGTALNPEPEGAEGGVG